MSPHASNCKLIPLHINIHGSTRVSDGGKMFSLVAGRTTLGSEGTDIPLLGPGIVAQHCYIENNAGSITLYPCGNQCAVDGLPVTKPHRLTQGTTILHICLVFWSWIFTNIDVMKRVNWDDLFRSFSLMSEDPLPLFGQQLEYFLVNFSSPWCKSVPVRQT